MCSEEFPVPRYIKKQLKSLLAGESFDSLLEKFNYLVNPLENSIWSKDKMTSAISKNAKLGRLDQFFPLISKSKSAENNDNNDESKSSASKFQLDNHGKKEKRSPKKNKLDIAGTIDEEKSHDVKKHGKRKSQSPKKKKIVNAEDSGGSSSDEQRSSANLCSETFNELSLFHSTAIGDANKSIFPENSEVHNSDSDSSSNSNGNTTASRRDSLAASMGLQSYSQYSSGNGAPPTQCLSDTEESDETESEKVSLTKKTNKSCNGISSYSNLTSTVDKLNKHSKDKKSVHSLSDEEIIPPSQEFGEPAINLTPSLKTPSSGLNNKKSVKSVSFKPDTGISGKETTNSAGTQIPTWLEKLQDTMKNSKHFNSLEDNSRSLRIEDVTDDNEYFVIQVPKEVDVKSFVGKNITENNSITLQEEGHDVNYNCFVDRQMTDQAINVVLPTKKSEVKIGNIPIAGRIIFTKCPDVSIFKCEVEVSPSINTSFPNRLQGRLSLLPTISGVSSDLHSLSDSSIELIKKRKRGQDISTEGSDLENCLPDVPKKKKKIRLSNSQKEDTNVEEYTTTVVEKSCDDAIEGKKKKKKHSREEDTNVEYTTTVVQESCDDAIEEKKKKKHSREEDIPIVEYNDVGDSWDTITERKKKKKHREEISAEVSKLFEESDHELNEKKKKKKKKHHQEDMNVEEFTTTVVEESCDDAIEETKKKKKHSREEVLSAAVTSLLEESATKKKKRHQEEISAEISSLFEESGNESNEPKEKKKKKKHHENMCVEESIVVEDSCDETKEKKKKKKKKHHEEDMLTEECIVEDSCDVVTEKKKKKKHNQKEVDPTSSIIETLNESVTEDVTSLETQPEDDQQRKKKKKKKKSHACEDMCVEESIVVEDSCDETKEKKKKKKKKHHQEVTTDDDIFVKPELPDVFYNSKFKKK